MHDLHQKGRGEAVSFADIDVEDGKYTIRLHNDGRVEARRYNGEWIPNVSVGANMVRALAIQIQRLRKGYNYYLYLEDGVSYVGNLPIPCPNCGRMRLNLLPVERVVQCEKCDGEWSNG